MPEERRALVVDDDPVSRQFVADTLTRHGFRAYASGDAEAALASVARNGPFDLLVVDLLLPGLRGAQLVREIENAHGVQRVLYVSARATAPSPLGPAQRFLAKPYSTGELMAAVRALLV
ncbi:MAG: response regulator transcription factor [Myxococcota bacterium]